MNRPERKSFKPVYHWCDIVSYVEFKHGITLRAYKLEVDGVRRDFWHFIMEMCNPSRGSFFRLPEDMGGTEPWQQEIMDLILAEFPELVTESIWVDW